MSPPEPRKAVAACGHQAPSADNTQPWHFLWEGDTLHVEFDDSRKGRTFSPASNATLLSMGAVLENLLQCAFDTAPQIRRFCPPTDGMKGPRYFSIGFDSRWLAKGPGDEQPLFQRHTNHHPFTKQVLELKVLDDIAQLQEGRADIRLVTDKDQILQLADMVRRASQVRFQTREVHEWLMQSLRFSTKESVKNSDSLDIRTLHLPPGAPNCCVS